MLGSSIFDVEVLGVPLLFIIILCAGAYDEWQKKQKREKQQAAEELERIFEEAVKEEVARRAGTSSDDEGDEWEAEADDAVEDEDEDGDDEEQEEDEEFLRDLNEFGLDEDATWEDVQRAYRELARSFHPDVLAAKELPPKLVDFAQQRFNRVTKAYKALRSDFETED